jgi:hypothetical protein
MPRNCSTDRRSGASSPKRIEYIFRMTFTRAFLSKARRALKERPVGSCAAGLPRGVETDTRRPDQRSRARRQGDRREADASAGLQHEAAEARAAPGATGAHPVLRMSISPQPKHFAFPNPLARASTKSEGDATVNRPSMSNIPSVTSGAPRRGTRDLR